MNLYKTTQTNITKSKSKSNKEMKPIRASINEHIPFTSLNSIEFPHIKHTDLIVTDIVTENLFHEHSILQPKDATIIRSFKTNGRTIGFIYTREINNVIPLTTNDQLVAYNIIIKLYTYVPIICHKIKIDSKNYDIVSYLSRNFIFSNTENLRFSMCTSMYTDYVIFTDVSWDMDIIYNIDRKGRFNLFRRYSKYGVNCSVVKNPQGLCLIKYKTLMKTKEFIKCKTTWVELVGNQTIKTHTQSFSHNYENGNFDACMKKNQGILSIVALNENEYRSYTLYLDKKPYRYFRYSYDKICLYKMGNIFEINHKNIVLYCSSCYQTKVNMNYSGEITSECDCEKNESKCVYRLVKKDISENLINPELKMNGGEIRIVRTDEFICKNASTSWKYFESVYNLEVLIGDLKFDIEPIKFVYREYSP